MTNQQTFIKSFSLKEDSSIKNTLRFHSHHNYELFAVIDGEITLNTERISYKCRNSVILIPPNYNHYVNFENATAVVLNLVPQATNKKAEPAFDNIIRGISGDISIFNMTRGERLYCSRLIEANGEDSFADVEPHLISLLLIELLSHLSQHEIHPQKQSKNQYSTAIDSYVATHINKKIQLNQLAEMLHLCPKQVSRIIKREYGCTLAELVKNHRMSVAAMLLTTTNMKVYEISDAVGYESPMDFRNNFKKAYGITPTDYRRKKALI